MLLIDFDKLMEAYNDFFDEFTVHDLRYLKKECLPTVEAIPIEWFEWLLDTMGDGMYNLRAVIKDWERYKEDWEKENETN